jgi:hypothetical protein
MNRKSLRRLDGELTSFLDEMFQGMGRRERGEAMRAYVSGLLLDGDRKSVVPMAARLVGERPPDRGRTTVDRRCEAGQRGGRARAQAAGMSAGIFARRMRRESLGSTSARYSTGLMSMRAQQPSTV